MIKTLRHLIVVLALAGLAVGLAAPAVAGSHEAFTPVEEDAIERIVRDYLLKNPEIVLEALETLEARRKLAQEQRSREQLRTRQEEILNDPSSPVGWNPEGDVTIVEFFDYQCPYCRAVAPRLAELKRDDGSIRYVYKEWPILGPVSQVAARAALAAEKQGRYEAFHEALMAFPKKLSEAEIFKTAETLGLDMDRLRDDMKSQAIDDALARTSKLARALGISGTPAFVIGDQLVRGAVDLARLKEVVREAREGT
jgi:protein-disulfide isomerase